jgi:hypothetical protein
MESHLQKTGDWQGTSLVAASDTWAVFAFMGKQGEGLEIWTEQVLAWVMAERRYAAGEFGTVFYGVSLQSTRRGEIYRGPDVCEAIHDERGCHLGYSKSSLVDAETRAWQDAAGEHMRRCTRRRMAVGPK